MERNFRGVDYSTGHDMAANGRQNTPVEKQHPYENGDAPVMARSDHPDNGRPNMTVWRDNTPISIYAYTKV